MSGAGVPDFFCREAQRLGYVARSAFKLLQIQKQHRIIKYGSSVLDLGCAPGAWLQVSCQSLGPLDKGGVVVGVDIKKVKVPSSHCDNRVRTLSADVFKIDPSILMSMSPMGRGFSVILSDMCSPVSGVGSRDAALSGELGLRALELALGESQQLSEGSDDGIPSLVGTNSRVPLKGGLLLRGGNLVVKLLEGEESQGFTKLFKERFQTLSWLRPKATRSSSREIYLIARTRR